VVAIIVGGIVAVVAILAGTVLLMSHHGAAHTSAPRATASSTTTRTTTTVKQATFAQLFAADSSGVVRVDATGCSQTDVGSGFLISPNLVATAAHVVEGAANITLHGKSSTSIGQVVGIDTNSDVALIRATTPLVGHVFKLAHVSPAVGTPVATIGFPEALPITLTQGTVSATDRSAPFTDGVTRSGLIQTDTPVNPGNSGGPLLISDGTVVGMVEGDLANANGIGYATGPETEAPLLAAWRHSPEPVTLSSCGLPAGGSDVQGALALVQSWATALATGDWTTARQVDPGLASMSDSALEAGYGGLKQAQIAYVSGDPENLDIASVAYEDVGSGERTNVYCYALSVDLGTSTLTVLSQREATQPPIPGWVDPNTLDGIIATC
jgi:S1-C subfamily serine protease